MKKILSIAVLLAASNIALAQPTRPRPPCFPPSKCIPIDGGVIVLGLAGLSLACSKVKRKP